MRTESYGSLKLFYPEFSRDELIGRLRESCLSLAAVLPVQRATLFGSWAVGRATAFSDVDVLVVYADPPRDDAYSLVTQYLDVSGVEAHVYAESEAAPVQATLMRMTRDGVDLLIRPITSTRGGGAPKSI